MRSIGAKNKAMVKRITLKVMCQIDGVNALIREVISKVPEEVFDTWEGAYSEIENIISDTMCGHYVESLSGN